MKIKHLRENASTNAAIELMMINDEFQDEHYVGCFWYDTNKNELFGVSKTLAMDTPYYNSSQFDVEVKTGRMLHKFIWNKEAHRGRDKRFSGDYTKVPRGRVFQFSDNSFRVYTGNWLDDYQQAKDEIMYEFQLPEDTQFIKDEHWDLGHGWSDEY